MLICLAVLALLLSPPPLPGGMTIQTAITPVDAQGVPGTNASFAIQVSADEGASDVVASGSLPDGVTFADSDTCEAGGPGVECDFGDLDAGESASAVLRVALSPSMGDGSMSLTLITGCADCGSPLPATVTLPLATQADLSLDLDGPAVIDAGSTAAYTLTVANDGPSDSQDVVVRERIPAPLKVVSGCPCEIDVLPAGEQRSFRVVVRAPDDVGAEREVEVTATATADTPDPSGNSASIQSEIRDDARFSVQVTTGAATITPGEPFRYVVEVRNQGPSPAREVVVRDLLPKGLSGDDAGDRTLGDIPAGESRKIEVTATADPSMPAGTVTDTARAECADCGRAVRVSSHTRVRPEARLVIAATSNPDTLEPGQRATRTVTLVNEGPSTATDLTLTDAVPAGLTLSPVDDCALAGNLLTCPVKTLPVRQSRTWTMTAIAPATIDHPTTLIDQIRTGHPKTLIDPRPDSVTLTTLLEPAPDRLPWYLGGALLLLLVGVGALLLIRRKRKKA